MTKQTTAEWKTLQRQMDTQHMVFIRTDKTLRGRGRMCPTCTATYRGTFEGYPAVQDDICRCGQVYMAGAGWRDPVSPEEKQS